MKNNTEKRNIDFTTWIVYFYNKICFRDIAENHKFKKNE